MRPRSPGYTLASCKSLWLVAWSFAPVLTGASLGLERLTLRLRTFLARVARIERVTAEWREPREIRRQDGKDCVEDSTPEHIGFCLDFHLGTRARNSVSSGRKRRLPPQGTDKDLINASESHPSWPGARTFRWRIAKGKALSRVLDSPLSPTKQLWGAVSFEGREAREKTPTVKSIKMQS